MGAFTIFLAVIAGVAGSVQVAVMSKLGDRVGIFGAVAWAATLTAVLAVAVLLVAKQSLSPFVEAARQPVWLWSGAVDERDHRARDHRRRLAHRRDRDGLGAARGPVRSGAVIDQYGLLGAERVPVNWVRIFGIALLGIGAALTLKR